MSKVSDTTWKVLFSAEITKLWFQDLSLAYKLLFLFVAISRSKYFTTKYLYMWKKRQLRGLVMMWSCLSSFRMCNNGCTGTAAQQSDSIQVESCHGQTNKRNQTKINKWRKKTNKKGNTATVTVQCIWTAAEQRSDLILVTDSFFSMLAKIFCPLYLRHISTRLPECTNLGSKLVPQKNWF